MLDEGGFAASIRSHEDEWLVVLEPWGNEDEILLDLIRHDEGRVNLPTESSVPQLIT